MKKYSKKFLTKNGFAALELAREMLSFKPGDRIPRVRDYARQFGIGTGTVQSAFSLLEQTGAIQFESKGHLGTHIKSMNILKLWELVGPGVLVGAMPLPYSKRYEGLATGFYSCFSKSQIPFSMTYVRGSRSRVDGLLNGRYDFICVSGLAAEVLEEEGEGVEIWRALGEGTHVSGHSLLIADPNKKLDETSIVGIDSQSIDQEILTRAECEDKNVKFVEVGYMQLPTLLRNRKIDATVWNVDEIIERHTDIAIKPLQNPRAQRLRDKATEAVVLVSAEREDVANILDYVVDIDKVKRIQKEVMQNKILPTY